MSGDGAGNGYRPEFALSTDGGDGVEIEEIGMTPDPGGILDGITQAVSEASDRKAELDIKRLEDTPNDEIVKRITEAKPGA